MADPRTTAEPPTQAAPKSGGLSAQTLIIAAVSSAIAAIVVSRLWEQGTIIASAMTPVVVALVSEALRKPIQSDRVRRPVRAAGSSASRVSRISQREEARPPSGRTPNVIAPPPPSVDEGLRQRGEGVEPGPVKVYSSGSHRRPGAGGGGRGSRRVKVAVATGLIAFLVAAVALTLPELIFGGSVSGGERGTTYFGGGESSREKGESQDGDSRDGQPDEPTQEQAPSESGDEPAPAPGDDAAPAPTTPAPEQTAPPPTTTQPPPESPTQTAP